GVLVQRKPAGARAVNDQRHGDDLDVDESSITALPAGIGAHGFARRSTHTESQRFGSQFLRSQQYVQVLPDDFSLQTLKGFLKSGIAHPDAAFQVHDHNGDGIVLHDGAQRGGLFRDLPLGREPRGDIHRGHQNRIALAEADALRGDLNVENFPILAAMLPYAQHRNRQGVLAEYFHQPRQVFGRTNVRNFQPQEFFTGEPEVLNRGSVDVEIF